MTDAMNAILAHSYFVAPVLGLCALGMWGRTQLRVLPVVAGLAALWAAHWTLHWKLAHDSDVGAVLIFMLPACLTFLALIAFRREAPVKMVVAGAVVGVGSYALFYWWLVT